MNFKFRVQQVGFVIFIFSFEFNKYVRMKIWTWSNLNLVEIPRLINFE